VDSPRIDLKVRPLYEEAQLAMLKTHYYGGLRKYQWVALPLALHGIVSMKDGSLLEVVIGEDAADPVLCITDLLPHLSAEQNKRTLNKGIKGEELNALIGSLPYNADESEKTPEQVKLNVMRLLNEKYGLVEADFLSADLQLVPALPARDVGLDRSMVGAYGHDDRVCAYTSIMAALDAQTPETTWINILADKEETGSEGATGLQSRMLEYFIAGLASARGESGAVALKNSQCLSADVTVAFDPTFPEVTDKRNTAYLNYGVSVMKYSGSRGKASTNEATAEYMGKIRRLLDSNEIPWQTGELGKVDEGGGGTVAMYISKLGVDVVDVGVPVLSMHAPFEVVGKADVYSAYLAFKAFFKQ
jgi:aspartyl aminopeptidase